jgi:protein-S-isoprenylcysteine O-methyltransferase Ste14
VFILIRALVYASLFIGLLLVALPGRLLAWSGIAAPARFGPYQVAGIIVAAAGAVLAIGCVLTFALRGRGTPAPFDPPRRLVVTGPYRFLRNPMYAGAWAALLGAAVYYGSWALTAYAVAFLAALALFVRFCEEPVLRRTFGVEYDAYCRRVGRWWPRRASRERPRR